MSGISNVYSNYAQQQNMILQLEFLMEQEKTQNQQQIQSIDKSTGDAVNIQQTPGNPPPYTPMF